MKTFVVAIIFSVGLSAGASVELNRLPLQFEKNTGFYPGSVQYLSRAGEITAFFTQDGITVSLSSASGSAREDRKNGRPAARPARSHALQMQFVGSRPLEFEGEDRVAAISNYLIGNDRTRWRTEVPNFGRIRARGLYPGVDLLYYGNGRRQLEYDLVVRPGGDVSRIKFRLAGADWMTLGPDGDLRAETTAGLLRHTKPLAYQRVNGVKTPIAAEYLLEDGAVRIAVGSYDASRELIIDPVLIFSTYLGGSATDAPYGIARDGSGNVYVAGSTDSTNFPTTSGVVDTSYNTNTDVFITKLNAGATARVYSTYLGGTLFEVADAIAVDGAGGAIVAGETSSGDFPTTPGVADTSFNGGAGDGYLAKLNAAGTALTFSTFIGGTDFDSIYALAIDSGGASYLTGITASADFPTTSGAFDTSYNGGGDAFVVKLNASATTITYSTFLGGSIPASSFAGDLGFSIAVDATGAAYVGGSTASTNFPTTSGVLDTTVGGTEDGFVSKLNPAGSALDASTYLGGSTVDRVLSVAVDGAGGVYVAGETDSSNFPVSLNAADTSANGGFDAFVTKLNSGLTTITYSTFIGGSGDELDTKLAVDTEGTAVITGLTDSPNYPVTSHALSTVLSGPADAFVTRLDMSGTSLIYSTYLGGTGAEQGSGVLFGPGGTINLAGITSSTNFPTTSGVADTTANGSFDGFVSSLDVRPSVSGSAKLAALRNGQWIIDRNGTFTWDGEPGDWFRSWTSGNSAETPVAGDWNGDGRKKLGVFFNGLWRLDYNGNGIWDGDVVDRQLFWGSSGDRPVVGNWNGVGGVDKIGVYNPSQALFVLDYNGNYVYDGAVTDRFFQWGSPSDVPVVGDWNGSGATKVGVFNPTQGLWVIDYNGNSVWDGIVTDRYIRWGSPGDTPVVGDWNGNGSANLGVFNPSQGVWVLDRNGNYIWDGSPADGFFAWGSPGDTPVAGDWDGTGFDKVGAFNPTQGYWVLDYNGNFIWEGSITDRYLLWGQPGDTPVPAAW